MRQYLSHLIQLFDLLKLKKNQFVFFLMNIDIN